MIKDWFHRVDMRDSPLNRPNERGNSAKTEGILHHHPSTTCNNLWYPEKRADERVVEMKTDFPNIRYDCTVGGGWKDLGDSGGERHLSRETDKCPTTISLDTALSRALERRGEGGSDVKKLAHPMFVFGWWKTCNGIEIFLAFPKNLFTHHIRFSGSWNSGFQRFAIIRHPPRFSSEIALDVRGTYGIVTFLTTTVYGELENLKTYS